MISGAVISGKGGAFSSGGDMKEVEVQNLPGPREVCSLGSRGVSLYLALSESLSGSIDRELLGLEIPRGSVLQRFREVPDWLPAEEVEGFVDG